jgi:putative transposase
MKVGDYMTFYKAYKFRLYPNDKQKEKIHSFIGVTRFVYNYFLELKKTSYEEDKKNITKFVCCNLVTRLLKAEHPWIKSIDSLAIRAAIFDLDDAYQSFYRGNGHPKFKSKYRSRASYRTTYVNDNIRLDLDRKVIRLPKLKDVKIRGYRNLNQLKGRIIHATVTKETTEKYYVSLLCEEKTDIEKLNYRSIVGVDLGIKDLIVTSDGEVYKNPQSIKRFEKRIKRKQRELSRRKKGSQNYRKTKVKLAILFKKLKNTRKYLIHSITNKLIKDNDLIAVENLQVTNMLKDKKLSKLISDASFHEIKRVLKYKTEWQGKRMIEVDTYYPSSQICSRCDYRNHEMKNLTKRVYECECCGNKINRDLNASINIMFEGLKLNYSK